MNTSALSALIIFSWVVTCPLFSQERDTISAELVASVTTQFKADTSGIYSNEKLQWLDQAKKGHYVLMGEYHDNPQISALTAAWLTELADHGYDHFILEMGPTSRQILSHLLAQSDHEDRIRDLMTSYYATYGDVPIPFCNNEEDFLFLNAAKEKNYQLHGIDQEYISSLPLLVNHIFQSLSDQEKKQLSDSFGETLNELGTLYQALRDDEDFPITERLVDAEKLNAFLGAVTLLNDDLKQKVNDIHQTLRIYNNYTQDRHANLQERAALMKALFSQVHQNAMAASGNQAKFFVKMGGWHIMKGWTYNSVYDIGSMVNELAAYFGQKSINIGFQFRYGMDEDGLWDNSEGESEWLNQMRPLLLQGKKDQWTCIDMRKIERKRVNREWFVWPEIAKYARQFDLIMIPPTITDPTPMFGNH